MATACYSLGLWLFASGIVAAYATGTEWLAGAGVAAGVIVGGETSRRAAIIRLAQAMLLGAGGALIARDVQSFPAQAIWTGALLWCAYTYGYDRGAVAADDTVGSGAGPVRSLRFRLPVRD